MMKNKIHIFLLLSLLPAWTPAYSQDGQQLSLTLEQCKEMAVQNNTYVLNAGLDVYAAVARKREAMAEYFPKVSVTALSFYAFNPLLEIGVTDILGHSDLTHNLQNIINDIAPQFGFSPVYSALKSGVTANVMVTQPVFAGGRIVTGNRMAALGVEAARLQQQMQLRNTEEEVEKNYWQIVSLEEKLQTVGHVQRLLDTLYRDALAACGAGLVTGTDLLQVKLKQNEMKSAKILLDNGIVLAKMNFFNSIGLKYNPYTSIKMPGLPEIDDIILCDELAGLEPPEEYYRPEEEIVAGQEEMKLLDVSVEAKRLEKRMAIGEALPQIAVGATYGYNNLLTSGNVNGLVFAMVQIPISDWGKTARKAQRLEYQIQKAGNEREYYSMQLLLQVRKLWFDMTAAWEQLQVAEESVTTAQAVVSQMMDNYLAGMIPVSELLQAQTQLRQSADQYVDQCINYRNAVQAYVGRVR